MVPYQRSTHDSDVRKVAFVTGTRADFGKLKPLISKIKDLDDIEVHLFVTGMHMLSRYGYTCTEVEKSHLGIIYKFINQNHNDGMDHVLSKTIMGLADYVREIEPDLLVIHGDRVEALAGATVGSLNNILTAHVEGGEVSGTVDELIRHAVTKLSHFHLVANKDAAERLKQLGEQYERIHVIGSPDIDVMNSEHLPSLDAVKRHYEISFDDYAIVLFHPVTTEYGEMAAQARAVVDTLLHSERNYVVIYPNNDHGSDIILEEYRRFTGSPRIRMFPSIAFENFLTLLKNADFIIGNSSAGIREAPHFGVPAVNIGSRQFARSRSSMIINVNFIMAEIVEAIAHALALQRQKFSCFGDGCSAERFLEIVGSESFWKTSTQKYFIDLCVA